MIKTVFNTFVANRVSCADRLIIHATNTPTTRIATAMRLNIVRILVIYLGLGLMIFMMFGSWINSMPVPHAHLRGLPEAPGGHGGEYFPNASIHIGDYVHRSQYPKIYEADFRD